MARQWKTTTLISGNCEKRRLRDERENFNDEIKSIKEAERFSQCCSRFDRPLCRDAARNLKILNRCIRIGLYVSITREEARWERGVGEGVIETSRRTQRRIVVVIAEARRSASFVTPPPSPPPPPQVGGGPGIDGRGGEHKCKREGEEQNVSHLCAFRLAYSRRDGRMLYAAAIVVRRALRQSLASQSSSVVVGIVTSFLISPISLIGGRPVRLPG